MNKHLNTTFIFILLFILTLPLSYSIAGTLSQKEVLARCYTHITGERLNSSSQLWSRLQGETSSSICLSLIEQIKFNTNGTIDHSDSTTNRSILKKFIDFHRTWFTEQWAFQSNFPDELWGGVDVYDPQEPALFLSYNLFSGTSYNKVLSGNMTAVAIRDGTKLQTNLPSNSNGFLRPSRITNFNAEGPIVNSANLAYSTKNPYSPSDISLLPTPIIQMGETIGISFANYNLSPLAPVVWTDIYTPSASNSTMGVQTPQAILANRGGGALGSVPYLLLNFGHGFEYKSNGAEKLPRRYILSVFKDFLCRQGPFVRSSDVLPWKSSLDKAPPFRKYPACLRCHTALDQAAIILRNFRLGGLVNGKLGSVQDYRTPPVLVSYTADPAIHPSEFWPSTSDENFHLTKPEGRLYFRSISGDLVNLPIDSLESFGAALAQTPDYYACAASRYFEFFTNNKTPLFDPYDPSNETLAASLTKKDLEMKSFVLALGKNLQATGSLKDLIRRIIESDYYHQADFGK